MKDKKSTVSTNTKTKNKGVKIPELMKFLKAGAHFGHKTSAWNPKMKKYIYQQRNGVHIIDLIKSKPMLEKALNAIEDASNKGYVLFVGTKGQAATIVQNKADEVGAFYIVKRWPGGLFTNFGILKKGVFNLLKMEESRASGGKGLVKKEVLMMERKVQRMNKIYEGIKFMDKLPALVIVVDSKVEKNAIREAGIAGIPTVALVDTNCDPDIVDYPIPANDDSLKSITLYVELFGQAIKNGSKSQALIALRKNHKANLKNLNDRYIAEKERVARMEEEERVRMKILRDGKTFSKQSTGVVRVVKKKKNIEEDIKAAEAVKAKTDSKNIEELGLGGRIEKALIAEGITTLEGIVGKSKKDLIEIKGIGEKAAESILKAIK
ncbi:30S ribosomal protein S2 [bacterium]|nr:30S ribosomal protein S2 [bacterium]